VDPNKNAVMRQTNQRASVARESEHGTSFRTSQNSAHFFADRVQGLRVLTHQLPRTEGTLEAKRTRDSGCDVELTVVLNQQASIGRVNTQRFEPGGRSHINRAGVSTVIAWPPQLVDLVSSLAASA
jgi:hypothetical protein